MSTKHTGSKKARSTDYEPGWGREGIVRRSCQVLCGRGEEEERRREDEEVAEGVATGEGQVSGQAGLPSHWQRFNDQPAILSSPCGAHSHRKAFFSSPAPDAVSPPSQMILHRGLGRP